MRSGGSRANQNGQTAEVVIGAVLHQKRLAALRQYPIGLGIYETPLKVDFYVPIVPLFPAGLIVEAKWQESGGSADEKLAYLVINVLERYPCSTVIVIDGIGARQGAINWMHSKIGGNLIAVFNLQEFVTWCNRNF